MISDRIEALIAHFCNGNKSLFAQKIGVTPSVIGNITGERKGNPSFEVIQKILDAFASVNPDWFILDRGSMLREPVTPPCESVSVPSDAVTLRLMDKLDKKEAQIDDLQSELRTMAEELATLKAKSSQESPPGVVRKMSEGLGSRTAETVSTKKHSSQSIPDVPSVTVPSQG